MDEVDHMEKAIRGQNERTRNQQKDGKTPFPGRVGIIPERLKSLENPGLLRYGRYYEYKSSKNI